MNQKEKIIRGYGMSECVRMFDDTRSSGYGRKWHNKFEEDMVTQAIGNIKDDRISVLDVACGTGRHGKKVIELGDKINYTGIDTSEEMLKAFKNKMRGKKINVKIADATKLPFKDNTFDISYTFHLLWHLKKEDQIKIIKEMKRVTKKNGLIIFDSYNKNFLWHKIIRKRFKKGHEIYKLSVNEIRDIIGNVKHISAIGILDPHFNSRILFHITTFIPNKLLRRFSCLHHMIYYICRK